MADSSEIHVNTGANKKIIYTCVILCIVGILLNLIPSTISTFTGCPLYLDTIGTIFTAALGGYIPGIVVGLVTNFVKGLTDITSVYYAAINVLIAVTTTFLYNRGFFDKIYKAVFVPIVLSALGGGLGGLLPYILEDFPTEGFINDLGIDFIDKVISIVVILIIFYILPDTFKNSLKLKLWCQRPLDIEEEFKISDIKTRRTTLRFKALLILSISLVAMVTGATIISFILYRDYTLDEYNRVADNVATSVESILDPEKITQYMEDGDSSREYKEIEEKLTLIRDTVPDVEYLYVYQIEEDGCHVVFDLDTFDVLGSDPGDIMDFDESFMPYLDDLLKGNAIEPIISNDTFGWLLTRYTPLYDSAGNCVAYIGSDITMNKLVSSEMSYIVQMSFIFIAFAVLIIAFAIFAVKYGVVYPINSISATMQHLEFDDNDALKENLKALKELDIWTGDEVEKLYYRILRMNEKSIEYMEEMLKKEEALSQMQTSLIIVLADMVESRDKNTGQHIKKTAAYVEIILNQMKELGMHKDILTDEYISNVIRSAPLHDIGKIQVPDAVLNKPGKLDDEEFEIMKSHTTAGEFVIDRVIKEVPESDYLSIAKDLALYHHEKWNGKGYPNGISGTDIPLSARVMAVADVFDALVSKRIYKPGMPMDKAFNIIKEDAGSHFDPEVVEAFFAAEDKIRQVEEIFSGLEENKDLFTTPEEISKALEKAKSGD